MTCRDHPAFRGWVCPSIRDQQVGWGVGWGRVGLAPFSPARKITWDLLLSDACCFIAQPHLLYEVQCRTVNVTTETSVTSCRAGHPTQASVHKSWKCTDFHRAPNRVAYLSQRHNNLWSTSGRPALARFLPAAGCRPLDASVALLSVQRTCAPDFFKDLMKGSCVVFFTSASRARNSPIHQSLLLIRRQWL